jgi:hypothetical protein
VSVTDNRLLSLLLLTDENCTDGIIGCRSRMANAGSSNENNDGDDVDGDDDDDNCVGDDENDMMTNVTSNNNDRHIHIVIEMI